MTDKVVSRVAAALRDAGALKHGEFILKSGAVSPIYVDLRNLPSAPSAMDAVTDALAAVVKSLDVEAVAGAETAGIPLAAVVAHKLALPMLYVRKEPKGYGAKSQIEGIIREGQRVALMDDLITQGASKFIFLDALQEAGIVCKEVVIVLDREQGGAEAMAARGMRLHSLITLQDLLGDYHAMGELSEAQFAEIQAYLNGSALLG